MGFHFHIDRKRKKLRLSFFLPPFSVLLSCSFGKLNHWFWTSVRRRCCWWCHLPTLVASQTVHVSLHLSGNNNNNSKDLCMATQIPSTADDSFSFVNATAVAIDKDKNSQYAVRWTVDNLAINNPSIVLLHVRHKNHQYHSNAEVSSGGEGEAEEVQQFFTPFRAYCVRKGVLVKEVVLDHIDVSRALLDFISQNLIGTIVMGASARNALTRKFKNQDVPTTLLKTAPDFCSVYVISKGKVLSVHNAQRVPNTAVPPRMTTPQALPPHLNPQELGELEDGVRGQSGTGRVVFKSTGSVGLENMRSPLHPRHSNLSVDSLDISFPGTRPSYSRESTSDVPDFTEQISLGFMDIAAQNLDMSLPLASSSEPNSQPARELEAEMRRLKIELKQTMDLYSTACKEALSAKKKANELHQWKMEEARRFEEARLAEETALAIAEMEKAKCKAAIEAAEKSQKLAEMEAKKRKFAEMKAKREAEEKYRALNALQNNDARYRRYSIEEIEEATQKFSQSLKIGEGGYGPVYRAKLDHTQVAIKVLRPDAAQGKRQFQQEVEVLSCLRHPNMVLLLGACPEYGCLVYEYMENGSLEDRLLRKDHTPTMSWRTRFKIAAEIGTALLFLHQAKPEPLVHRDLKPANILIDRNYVSKISDVGLARLVPPSIADSVTQYHMTSAAGTFCYIDPEYQQTGMLTTKSDIYSLGIMLLQIITARPPMGLAHQVGKAIERGKFAELLDPTVTDWPVEEAQRFALLALKCAELRKKDRPSLAAVIVPELNQLSELGMTGAEPYSSHDDVQSPRYSKISCSRTPMQPHSSASSALARIQNASQVCESSYGH